MAAEESAPAAPVLVLACGNESRGDDGLGPRFVEVLERDYAAAIAAGALECRCAYQWQIEDALSLIGRKRVLFVDATVGATAPCELAAVARVERPGVLSHALSPAELLAVYRRLYGEPGFDAEVLSIAGLRFALGQRLSAAGERNLAAGLARFQVWYGGGG